MKRFGKLIDLYLLTLILLGTIALALRTVACFADWNSVTGHFDSNVIISVANVSLIAAMLLFATYPLLADKDNRKIASSGTPHSYIPSGMLAIALLFASFERLSARAMPEMADNAVLRALALIIFILGILSAVFFFLSVLIEKNEDLIKAIFGMALVVFCAVSAAYLYFDKSLLPTNSPVKIVDMMAYLFAAMFFLFETRIALGRAIWRAYVPFGLWAAILTAYSSVPTLIYYAVSGDCISGSPYECALLLTMSLFISARIFMTRQLHSVGACDAARCIETLAAKREIELNGDDALIAQVHEGDNESNNMEETEAADFENYTIDFPVAEDSSSAEGEND